MAQANPFLLAADNSPSLLPLLRSNPSLASKQDEHGYSLLHAAASYNHISLLQALVHEFHVDINLRDEDGETCLFVTETVPVAKCLVEELHIDLQAQNDEGMAAVEKITLEDDFPELATYLQVVSGIATDGNTSSNEIGDGSSVHPPPLPPNVSVDVNTVPEQTIDEDLQADPEFKRRIQELAAKDNFHSAEGQQELRELITDALRGVGDARDVRRRVD